MSDVRFGNAYVEYLNSFKDYCLQKEREHFEKYGAIWLSLSISDIKAVLATKLSKARICIRKRNLDSLENYLADAVNYFLFLKVRRELGASSSHSSKEAS